jgi:peptide/nickel transport system substrate-binding protein
MKKLLALCACLLLFAACKKGGADLGAAADAGQSNGDMLIIGSIGEPLNLIPAIAHDSASHDAAELIYNGLIKSDKNMGIIGDLAESWEISPDNKSITFKLRQDVRWHDGAPFTAEDVVFTYNFMLDKNTPTAYDSDFLKIASIEALDEYTVVVGYNEPFAGALTSWGIWIMPKHLLEGVPATKSPLQRSPVGTGPYIFENWQANQSLTLTANHDYFEGRPHIEKVMFRYLQDQGAAFMELLNGTIDEMDLTAAQYTRQTDMERFRTQYK